MTPRAPDRMLSRTSRRRRREVLTTGRTVMELGDGRRLEVCVSGPEGGQPLLFHHGTPGTVPPRTLQGAVHARGCRLVTFARAGYAASTRAPGRAVVDVVTDAGAVLHAIGVDTFLLLGWSAGGPHALACAARLPGALRTLVVAGLAPRAAQGLDFFAGMDSDDVAEWQAAAHGDRPLRRVVERAAAVLTGDKRDRVGSDDLTAPDQDLVDDLIAANRHAVSGGVDGWVDDELALVRDWGFTLDEVAVPVRLWHGTADRNVPPDHGTWLADHLRDADLRRVDGHNHLSVLAADVLAVMLDDLIPSR